MSQIPGQPVVLCVLDGWGIGEAGEYNGITSALTPTWQRLWQENPHSQLEASGMFVGLPDGQMGNSEVGHMTLGLGRVIMQELPRIDQAIAKNEIPSLQAYKTFVEKLKASGGVCHIMGLLSPGGVHSHQDHMIAIAHYVSGEGIPVALHAFLDGRDTPPTSALEYIKELLTKISSSPKAALVSLSGRYYAMDRDKRWERVEKAFEAVVNGRAPIFSDPLAYISSSYAGGTTDEFILPAVSADYKGMRDGDGLFMSNFRADRVRQLLTALLDPSFKEFNVASRPFFAATLGMSEYSSSLTPLIPPLFEKQEPVNSLGELVSQAGARQLRIAETEKYAHVTFFFNGGREMVFAGEDRILVPSPAVSTYDLKPEMSAKEVTDRLVEAIHSKAYSLIVVNYANTDMVGHTGVIPAIRKAVETVDSCLKRLCEAAQEAGMAVLITADHGNAEQMVDCHRHEPHTAHTCNPVPFLAIGLRQDIKGVANGTLADVAPTILEIMGLAPAKEMDGKSLLQWV